MVSLRYTEEQFTKESNFLADNVAKNLQIRVIFRDTEEQFMRESNILADNVAKNLLARNILQNTKEQFMKVKKNSSIDASKFVKLL